MTPAFVSDCTPIPLPPNHRQGCLNGPATGAVLSIGDLDNLRLGGNGGSQPRQRGAAVLGLGGYGNELGGLAGKG